MIIQLVCLSIVLALSDASKWNTTDPVVKFYCEANDLRNVSVDLLYEHGINATVAQCCICKLNTSESAVRAAMEHFNRTCKTFTAVNAFKFKLQHYLFHDAHNANLEASMVQTVATIIVSLEAMVAYLQEIAVTEGTVCVRFTPTQYMKLYKCGLLYADDMLLSTTEAVLTSLVESALRTWLFPGGLGDALTTVPMEQPDPNDCIATIN